MSKSGWNVPRWRSKLAIAVALVVSAVITACLFDTRTTLCASGRRCGPGEECAMASDACILIDGCGNGVVSVERGEVCDDGNLVSGDGCSADCRSVETCGNRIIDEASGETCDDGGTIPGDGCSERCVREDCGNGILDRGNGEVCDDGNAMDGDGCSGNCMSTEICGNDVVDAYLGEECEHQGLVFPEAPPDTPLCDSDCTTPACGDGHRNPMFVIGMNDAGEEITEQCDDGGDSRGCDSDCTIAECGDEYINEAADEQCDTGREITAECNGPLCTFAVCGDSFYNPLSPIDDDHPLNFEECDTGGNTQACNANCTVPRCGDAFFNPMFTPPGASAAEACDMGDNDSATCDDDCTPVECGDGHINMAAMEQCEDTNDNDNDSCPDGEGGTCRCARCGDGIVQSVVDSGGPCRGEIEFCDMGGVNTAGCDRDCSRPHCGDGLLNREAGEECEADSDCDSASCDRCSCI